jgi:hypothetical protein
LLLLLNIRIEHLRIGRMLFEVMKLALFLANVIGVTRFGSELRRSIASLAKGIGGKGFQSLCGGLVLARIERAHTIFGSRKLQRKRRLHNKLLMHEMHYMSQMPN